MPATATHVSERTRWIAAMALVACVPVVAGVLYVVLGNPAAIDAARPPRGARRARSDPQIVAMVEQLAKRLQANPEDGEGWALLGRSYRVLGPLRRGGDGVRRGRASGCRRTRRCTSIGPKRSRRRRAQRSPGQPTELLERALKLEPDQPEGAGAAPARRPWSATIAQRRSRCGRRLRGRRCRRTARKSRQLDAALARAGATPGEAPAAPAAPAPRTRAAATRRGTRGGRSQAREEHRARRYGVHLRARPDGSAHAARGDEGCAAADLPRTFALTDEMAMASGGDDLQGGEGRDRGARQQVGRRRSRKPAILSGTSATGGSPGRDGRPRHHRSHRALVTV